MALCLCEETVDDLLRSCYENVLRLGTSISPSRGAATEVVGACLELTNPRARLSRTETRHRSVSALAELCWYLSGTNDVEPIAFYLPAYNDEAEDDGRVHGGYGPRLFGPGEDARLQHVIDALRAKPSSRRAVVQIFDHGDLVGGPYKDIPCTCTLQFLLRDEQLHMVVHMRSNDAYLGLPHDIFSFTMLQELVACSVGVGLGRYVHMVGSLHIYDHDQEKVKAYLGEGYQSTLDPMPPMPPGDPWAHVGQLLASEAALRRLSMEAGQSLVESLPLPEEAYWSDIARVLASWVAKTKLKQPDVAEVIKARISIGSLAEFI